MPGGEQSGLLRPARARSGVKGSARKRLPVALAMALATARASLVAAGLVFLVLGYRIGRE